MRLVAVVVAEVVVAAGSDGSLSHLAARESLERVYGGGDALGGVGGSRASASDAGSAAKADGSVDACAASSSRRRAAAACA